MKTIYEVKDLKGAVVVDNCATIKLESGELAIFKGGDIGPEINGKREFAEFSGEVWGDSIFLPVVFQEKTMTTQLNTLATRRLSAYRAKAEKHPHVYKTWRNCRYPKPSALKRSSLTRNKDNSAFRVDDLDNFPGANQSPQDAADINQHQGHSGWFTDHCQDNTAIPCVVSFRDPKKLNPEGSHLFYMPASRHSDWDGATVYNNVFDDALDAARAADEECRIAAEDERDYQAQWQAEQDIEEARAEIHQLNKTALPLIQEIKKTRSSPYPAPVCTAIEAQLRRILGDREQLFNKINALHDDYWNAVTGY